MQYVEKLYIDEIKFLYYNTKNKKRKKHMKYDLNKKVVLITGGAAGIGKELVTQAAQKGAHVVFCDVNDEKAKQTKIELKMLGLDVHYIHCNVAEPYEVEAMYNEIMKKFGRVEVLINNAAIQTVATIENTTYEDWKKVIDVNLNGVFYCMKNAAKNMKENSVMMNILTVYHNKARLHKYAYDAAKGGVASLTREFAMELAPKGIIVNGIYPGYVLTPMQEDESEAAYLKGIEKNLIKNTDASTAKGFAEYVLSYIEHFSHATTGYILGADAGRAL